MSDRQRRLGPAPIASFEDLSDELSSPEDRNTLKLEKISEERSSPVLTPLTPRIDVDHASSPSQKSSDSAPDIFALESGLVYMEGGDRELQSYVEELIEEDREKAPPCKKHHPSATSQSPRHTAHQPVHRLTSTSSNVSSGSRRSPSPHKMLLETSFCGMKPVLDDEIIAPILGGAQLLTPGGGPSMSSALTILSSPNLLRKPVKYVTEPRSRPASPNPLCASPTPSIDSRGGPLSRKQSEHNDTSCFDDVSSDNVSLPSRKVSEATDSNFDHIVSSETSSPKSVRRYEQRPQTLSTVSGSSKRAVSPFNLLYETSFCGAKPIGSDYDSEPLYLSLSRTPSRATSPRPVQYKSEPRSRPVSPMPPRSATLPASPSPFIRDGSARNSVRDRAPSPRHMYETSFVTNQNHSFEGEELTVKKLELKPASPRPIRYESEPRSRPTSPAVFKRGSDFVGNFDADILVQKVNAHMDGVETLRYDPRDRSDSISCEFNFPPRFRSDSLAVGGAKSPCNSRSTSPRVKYETSFCGSKPRTVDDEDGEFLPPTPKPDLLTATKPIRYDREPRSRSVSPLPARTSPTQPSWSSPASTTGTPNLRKRSVSPMIETSFCGSKPNNPEIQPEANGPTENHVRPDNGKHIKNNSSVDGPGNQEKTQSENGYRSDIVGSSAYGIKSPILYENEPRSPRTSRAQKSGQNGIEAEAPCVTASKNYSVSQQTNSVGVKAGNGDENCDKPYGSHAGDFVPVSNSIEKDLALLATQTIETNNEKSFTSFKTGKCNLAGLISPVIENSTDFTSPVTEKNKSPMPSKGGLKAVACPRVPENFKAVSTSTTPSGSPLSQRRPLGIANSNMAAGSAPNTPLVVRKVSQTDMTKPEKTNTIESWSSAMDGKKPDRTVTPNGKKAKGSKMFRFFKQKKKQNGSSVSTPDSEYSSDHVFDEFVIQPQGHLVDSVAKEFSEGFAAFESHYAADGESWEMQTSQASFPPRMKGDSEGSDEEPAIEHEVLQPEQGEPLPVNAVETEVENLVLNDSFEGELPYIPTTLPQEMPLAQPITPIRMRIAQFRETRRVDRPRATVRGPAPFDAYVNKSAGRREDGIKIKLPKIREESIEEKPEPTSVKDKFDWARFAESGLRTIKIYVTENSLDEDSHKPLVVVPLPIPSDNEEIKPVALLEARKWVNLEELPEQVKPVRKLQAQIAKNTDSAKNGSQSFDTVPETEVTQFHIRPISSVLSPGDCSSTSVSVNDGSGTSEVGLLEKRSESENSVSSHDRSSLISYNRRRSPLPRRTKRTWSKS